MATNGANNISSQPDLTILRTTSLDPYGQLKCLLSTTIRKHQLYITTITSIWFTQPTKLSLEQQQKRMLFSRSKDVCGLYFFIYFLLFFTFFFFMFSVASIPTKNSIQMLKFRFRKLLFPRKSIKLKTEPESQQSFSAINIGLKMSQENKDRSLLREQRIERNV